MASEQDPDQVADEELSEVTGGMNVAGVVGDSTVPVAVAEPATREHV